MRTGSVAVVALALLIILVTPTLASAGVSVYLWDQTHLRVLVVPTTDAFSIYDFTGAGVLLCSGVGARITNGGLVLTIQSSSWFGPGSYVKCQSGIYSAVRASGMLAGIVTVVLTGPTSVGYPPILVLSMFKPS